MWLPYGKYLCRIVLMFYVFFTVILPNFFVLTLGLKEVNAISFSGNLFDIRAD